MEKYNITGMSCAACVARVEKAVMAVDGVDSCLVNLLTNTANVEGAASSSAVIKAVEDAGYGASLARSNTNTSKSSDEMIDNEIKLIKRRLIASVIIILPLMYVSMGHMLLGVPLPAFLDGNHIGIGIYELVLSALVMVVNQKFFVNGFKGVIHKAPNMDTLVALGSMASFIYSLYALMFMSYYASIGCTEQSAAYMNEFYFESAAMILTLITVGKLLEANSKGKTTNALKGLMNMAPKTALVLVDGEERLLPIADVKVGNIVVIKPGAAIPVDGVVEKGESDVNEASLTGESMPVAKELGSRVCAGTINISGHMLCRVSKVGEDTALAKIIQMVSDASATKAPIARIADKVAVVFVPVVLAIAFVTFIIWMLAGRDLGFSLSRAISVLVISCPCALGLATPVAIMVGNGVSARCGVLFKNSEALEQTGRVNIVCLDKTGTITKGEPIVRGVFPAEGVDEQQLMTIACSVEQNSEHPLAKAIVAKAKELGINAKEAKDFKAIPGNGLYALVDEKPVFAGNYKYVSNKIDSKLDIKELVDKVSSEGLTPLMFICDNKYIGTIAVADTIKEDSASAIKAFSDLGIHTVMLTGDNPLVAGAIASEAGVDEVIAGVLPDGKANVIKALKEKGTVMMIGDGINDAPALSGADIGMAIGAGTDIAIDAADIVLMKNSLEDAVAAVRLSRQTIKNVHENLFWAFIYNIIGIPLAAGVWIPILGWYLSPMFGAAAMGLSSFCVVTNALRLNGAKPYSNKKDRVLKNTLGHGKLLEENLFTREDLIMTITVNGMMCGHCEAHVKKALEAIDGVTLATPNHETNQVTIETSKEVSMDLIKAAVTDAGYEFV